MSSPVNPIVVVKDNLPDFWVELLTEKQKLVDRIVAIDEQLSTVRALADVVGVPLQETMAVFDAEDDLPPGFDPQVHG